MTALETNAIFISRIYKHGQRLWCLSWRRDDDKWRSKIVRDDVVSSGIEDHIIVIIRYIGLSRVADDKREPSFRQPPRQDGLRRRRTATNRFFVSVGRARSGGPRDEWPWCGGPHGRRQPGRARAPHNPSLESTVQKDNPTPDQTMTIRAGAQYKHNNNILYIIKCFFNYYSAGEPYTILWTITSFGTEKIRDFVTRIYTGSVHSIRYWRL